MHGRCIAWLTLCCYTKAMNTTRFRTSPRFLERSIIHLRSSQSTCLSFVYLLEITSVCEHEYENDFLTRTDRVFGQLLGMFNVAPSSTQSRT